MSHHPTLSQLEALLCGTLPPEQAKDVIIHVLWSCKSCNALATPLFMDFLSQEFSAGPSAEEDVYEEALNRAISASLGHQTLVDRIISNLAPGQASLVLEKYAELPALAFYQAFLQKSWDLRYQDPRRMVTLAQAAVTVSEEMLEPEIYGEKEVKDFQCRAWIENGNALRVADDMAQAELAFSGSSDICVGRLLCVAGVAGNW